MCIKIISLYPKKVEIGYGLWCFLGTLVQFSAILFFTAENW